MVTARLEIGIQVETADDRFGIATFVPPSCDPRLELDVLPRSGVYDLLHWVGETVVMAKLLLEPLVQNMIQMCYCLSLVAGAVNHLVRIAVHVE